MPRPNPLRSNDREGYLAEQITSRRHALGWSYETLAARMSESGCPIQPSALHRVEKGEPRRRVTVNELVALALVFDCSIEELIGGALAVDQAVALALREWTQVFAWRQDLATLQENLRMVEPRMRASLAKAGALLAELPADEIASRINNFNAGEFRDELSKAIRAAQSPKRTRRS